MEVKDIITIVFSSTLLTTVITVIFNLLTIKRKDSIENITKERKEWREQLRIISKEIAETKNISELHIAISELKVRINAYGVAKNFIFHDSHLWEQISKIEMKSTLTDDELKKAKIYFVNQISCLLKYDWERSKAEIKGNIQTKVVIVSLIVAFLLYSTRWFYFYSSGREKISNYFSYCVLYVIIVAFSILVINLADKWKNSAEFYSYISLSLVIGILLYLLVYIGIQSARPFDMMDYVINSLPFVTLLYGSEIKLLKYRKNTSEFILSTAILSGENTIDKQYKIFFGKIRKRIIYTGTIIIFSD